MRNLSTVFVAKEIEFPKGAYIPFAGGEPATLIPNRAASILPLTDKVLAGAVVPIPTLPDENIVLPVPLGVNVRLILASAPATPITGDKPVEAPLTVT